MKTTLLPSFLVGLIFLLSSPVFAADEAPETASASAYQVNINTADVDELSSMLKGVGESKAKAIIAYREEHGTFGSIEDLLLVSGIGSQTLESNRHLLTTEIE